MKNLLVAILLSLTAFSVAAKGDVLELFWDELMPDDYTIPEAPAQHDKATANPMTQVGVDAPVVVALNGKTVRIPGFVVPLEGDDKVITEFLLVPYFGACVHMPPPPSNQIIHVSYPQGAPIEELYDAIWLTGELKTETWQGDVASVGYKMVGKSIAVYDE